MDLANAMASLDVLDSHCHAWRRWPYPPLVPDEDWRGTIEQLLYEMDTNGVTESAVVCAAIENNPLNVEYVAFARDRYPNRLHVIADLDCVWSTTYHAPGSADRLRALDDAYRIVGFTHYVTDTNDGWLRSDDAEQLFTLAERRSIFVSLAASPTWQADLRIIAERHPSVPILCHHLGGVRASEGPRSAGLAELVASAAIPNIFVKVSGFHYSSERGWDHPWDDAVGVFSAIFHAFGPDRLCWGSDFPASKRYCTYLQSLEIIRSKCDFLTADDRRRILGATLRQILKRRI